MVGLRIGWGVWVECMCSRCTDGLCMDEVPGWSVWLELYRQVVYEWYLDGCLATEVRMECMDEGVQRVYGSVYESGCMDDGCMDVNV